jgi:polysaccharide pyruvyl transferase WcaK-like protein
MKPKSRAQVVILGWYGSGNTGDEAVLEAIVGALRRRGVNDLHVLSTNPAMTATRLGISSSSRSLLDLGTLRALRRSKALILGGGGLIQDRTSVYNLPIYALYVLLARLFGLRVIGWGLGVEPLDTLFGKFLARFICGSSVYFSVRDAGCKRLLIRAGVPGEQVTISADPALLISPDVQLSANDAKSQSVAIFCLRDLPNNRPGLNLDYLLPISVRRRLLIGAKAERERTEQFVEAVARGVCLCVRELDAQVHFLAFWPGRDEQMINAVMHASERLGVPRQAMRLLDVEPVVPKIAATIGQADLLVSMRLHALIFGASQGVPMLALAYARKMRSFMRLMGAERWVIEVETHNPSAEEIESKLRLLWQARDKQSEIVREAASRARERAERDADVIAGLL